MIVFIAGMPRSGSTFSFNIVRRLLEARGSVHQEPTENIVPALQRSGEANHLLIKGHGADEITLQLARLGAIKAVCTVRKPEDAIASWMTTFGFTLEESLRSMEAWLEMFNVIRRHALIVSFEDIDGEPVKVAWKIGRYICGDADETEVRDIAVEFSKARAKELSERVEARDGDIEDIGFSSYDRKTYLHRRHVASLESATAVDRIGGDQVFAIRQALSRWCDAEGNLV